jgi:hypothetical protein
MIACSWPHGPSERVSATDSKGHTHSVQTLGDRLSPTREWVRRETHPSPWPSPMWETTVSRRTTDGVTANPQSDRTV